MSSPAGQPCVARRQAVRRRPARSVRQRAGLVGQARADVERDREGLVHHGSPSGEQPEAVGCCGRRAPGCRAMTSVAARRSPNRWAKRRCGRRYSSTGTWRRIFETLGDLAVARPRRPGTGRSPWPAGRSGSCRATPRPSRAGRARARAGSARRAAPSRARPWPRGRAGRRPSRSRRRGSRAPSRSAARSCPGRRRCRARSPTACVVAVRAAGGVAPERCTPVFM